MTHLPRFSFAAAFALLLAPALSLAATLSARLELPPNTDAATVRVELYDGERSLVENDPQEPLHTVTPGADGRFALELEATSPTLQLEVYGPTVRRARFPLAQEGPPDAVRVFKLDPGSNGHVRIQDEAGNPIAGALLGPVLPAEGAPAHVADVALPFFARTDEVGMARLDGLVPYGSYRVPVFAPGYERLVVTAVASASGEATILKPARHRVSGTIVGEKSLKLKPGVVARLATAPEQTLELRRRADESGAFSFEGVPPGRYLLMAVDENLPPLAPVDVQVMDGGMTEGLSLLLFEGVDVSGTVVDVEGLSPLSGVLVTLNEEFDFTDESGTFSFEGMMKAGTLAMEFPGYAYNPEDDDQGGTQLAISLAEDHTGLTIPMRRLRFLDVRTGLAEGDLGATLEVRRAGMGSDQDVRRHRVAEAREVLPLKGSGPMVAWMRAFDGRVSALTPFSVAAVDTTATLAMELLPAATINGTLNYEEGGEPAAPAFRAVVKAGREVLGEDVELLSFDGTTEGSFELTPVPPGTVTFALLRPEGGEPFHQETLMVAPGETVSRTLTTRRGLALAGRVINSEGNPVFGATISVYGVAPGVGGQPVHFEKTTGEDGAFRFEGLGGPAARQVGVSHGDYDVMEPLWDVPLPKEDLEIALTKNGVSVRVEGFNGGVGTRLYLMHGQQRTVGDGGLQWFYTLERFEDADAEGKATLRPRSSGPYRVAARSQDRLVWDVSETFHWNAAAASQEIVLEPLHTAELVVRLPENVDPEAVDYLLINTAIPEDQAPDTSSWQPSGRGAVSFPDLPAGEYLLLGYGPNGETATLTGITLLRGERKTVTLPLEAPNLTLDGTVVRVAADGSGAQSPAAGLAVALRFGDVPEAEVLMEERTDARGKFSFYPLSRNRPYLIEVKDGERTAQRTVNPSSAGAESGGMVPLMIELQAPREVLLPRVRGLREALPANYEEGGPPLILVSRSEPGTHIIPGARWSEPLSMVPGEYMVAWGEETIGQLLVPPNPREAPAFTPITTQ